MTKLDTDPYKGVRDFYPEDMKIQNHIFSTWRKVAEGLGYEEYNASILEPAELYKNKTSEEIVNEQTFSFIDRGGREVVLRPEMTPTLARMIAGRRRSLKFPLRWYSIPNLFRYEQPQRGRKREHWQLNCDLIGIAGVEAEVEIISLAYKIMREFGAKDEDFEIRINSRKILKEVYSHFGLEGELGRKVAKIQDKKDKLGQVEYISRLAELLGKEKAQEFYNMGTSKNAKDMLTENIKKSEVDQEVANMLNTIINAGIPKEVIKFSPTMERGFDYYTGMIFEVFDKNPENKRSLFGGGRYDNLLEIFGVEPVPTVGFGMGDITIRDFLETHKLGPYA